MNKQTVALLSVLSRCQPQDIEFARESKLQTILLSDDYLELAHRSAFSGIFQDLFTEEKLRSYDDAKLDAISSVIPHISECLEDIFFSLENGAAPSLTKVVPVHHWASFLLHHLCAHHDFHHRLAWTTQPQLFSQDVVLKPC